MIQQHNGGGGFQAAAVTTRSQRPMAEIPILPTRSCLALKPKAVQWKWKQERDEETLEFQPSVGEIWSLQRQPGSRRRRCAVAACSEL